MYIYVKLPPSIHLSSIIPSTYPLPPTLCLTSLFNN